MVIVAGVMAADLVSKFGVHALQLPACEPAMAAGLSLCLSEHWDGAAGAPLPAARFAVVPAALVGLLGLPRRIGARRGLCLALALGGVLANALEALARGCVTNWLRLSWGPRAFEVSAVIVNLADVAIVAGLVLTAATVASSEVRSALAEGLRRAISPARRALRTSLSKRRPPDRARPPGRTAAGLASRRPAPAAAAPRFVHDPREFRRPIPRVPSLRSNDTRQGVPRRQDVWPES